ncbi:MAG: FAD-dependent oxidoreductase [bacterium]|nr:FAD-dependent oxidoreductase [bacterium]
MKFNVLLLARHTVARDTVEFHFEKPANFEYKAGQTIDLTLINPPETDADGNTRTYSLVSASHEPHLAIATRMRRTAFKRVLGAMEAGGKVEIDGPMGSFTLHQNIARPAIFLVGGIGITPFYSMIKDATERSLPHEIYLFYSNRTPEDGPYLEELRALEKKNSHLHIVFTMTKLPESVSWEGERGYITIDMVKKYVPDPASPASSQGGLSNAIYYSAGPAAMVSAMRRMLADAGISDDDVRSEDFAGY